MKVDWFVFLILAGRVRGRRCWSSIIAAHPFLWLPGEDAVIRFPTNIGVSTWLRGTGTLVNGFCRNFNVQTFLPNNPRQRRITAGIPEENWCETTDTTSFHRPWLTLIGSSLIANTVLSLMAKYLKLVDCIRFAKVDSSRPFLQISFFRCKTAWNESMRLIGTCLSTTIKQSTREKESDRDGSGFLQSQYRNKARNQENQCVCVCG